MPWWRKLAPRLSEEASRRGAGFALALAIEAGILLLLLSLGMASRPSEPEMATISSFDVSEPPAPASEDEATTEPASASPPQSEPQPQPETPAPAAPVLPSALPVPVVPAAPPAPAPTPMPSPTSRIGAVVRSDMNYGPADTGSRNGEDSPVVGTAPDGSPLYAARWYREPTNTELAGYLSTASSPGWGLIACKTAPNWRVEDCRIVDEYPNGSGIARATQAAAWQFRVRPPRIGGEYQIGGWVRIRIDYTRTQQPRGY